MASMASIYEEDIRDGRYPQKVDISMPMLVARVTVANQLGKVFLRKQVSERVRACVRAYVGACGRVGGRAGGPTRA